MDLNDPIPIPIDHNNPTKQPPAWHNPNGLISLVRSRSSCLGVHPEVIGLGFDEAPEKRVETINNVERLSTGSGLPCKGCFMFDL